MSCAFDVRSIADAQTEIRIQEKATIRPSPCQQKNLAYNTSGPNEAMVKHTRASFPETNGWEFFDLDLSAQGTKIKTRGGETVNFQGVKCFSFHQPAAKFDFVCERTHGCAPVPLDDQTIAEIQAADPRCKKS